MKPVNIKTDGDNGLSVQTVYPYIDNGKRKERLPKRICLLVTYNICDESDGDIKTCEESVILDYDGVFQLIKELQEFINAPF